MFPNMLKYVLLVTMLGLIAGTALADDRPPAARSAAETPAEENPEMKKSDEQWRQELSSEQYQVLRCSATEAPFTGKYYDHHEEGTYLCAGCGVALFTSDTKYDSGSGWPSYFQPVSASAVAETQDRSHGMIRTEVSCARCGGHLGHVFPDGPEPTGLRYCINSAALDFRAKQAGEK